MLSKKMILRHPEKVNNPHNQIKKKTEMDTIKNYKYKKLF